MHERDEQTPSDVRSFLPRPGEPVEEYAERLRALHRDLTLVLEAVERGLAAAATPAAVPPPVPDDAPVEILPTHPAGPEPRSEAARPAPAGVPRGPRVEVLPPPTGEERRLDDEDRRRPDPPLPLPVETRDPEPRFTPDAPPAAESAPRPAPRFPARPSDAGTAPVAEPEWVERDAAPAPAPAPAPQQFTAPTLAPKGVVLSRPLLAAFAIAWAVVVGLLIALLLS